MITITICVIWCTIIAIALLTPENKSTNSVVIALMVLSLVLEIIKLSNDQFSVLTYTVDVLQIALTCWCLYWRNYLHCFLDD